MEMICIAAVVSFAIGLLCGYLIGRFRVADNIVIGSKIDIK